MTRIGRCMAAAAAMVLAASVAGAQDRGKGTEGLPGRSPSGQAGTSSPGGTGVGANEAAMKGDCSHRMTGTVTDVDKSTGSVSIDVAGANSLQLHLPPQELDGFEKGDQVVVSMGVSEPHAGAGGPAR